jgi:hypothetical protein
MTYIPSCVKAAFGIPKCQRHRGDLIGLFLFFKIRKVEQKTDYILSTLNTSTILLRTTITPFLYTIWTRHSSVSIVTDYRFTRN